MRLLRSISMFAAAGILAACSSSSPTTINNSNATAPFTVRVIYLSTPSAAFQTAMDSAVKRLQAIITAGPTGYVTAMSTADAASYTTTIRAAAPNGCGLTNATLPSGSYPGVVIFAQDTASLGSSNIIAQSGPCLMRGDGLPIISSMRFRTSYIATLVTNNQLIDVMTHEMLHGIGFNSTVFAARPDSAHPLIINAGTRTAAFIGANAKLACLGFSPTVSSTCSPSIPLDSTGVVGTQDDHWRETRFKSELMTGFIESPGVRMPLSAMTIGAMADIGFTVNMSLADPYTLPIGSTALMNLLNGDAQASTGTPLNEIITRPVGVFRPGQKP